MSKNPATARTRRWASVKEAAAYLGCSTRTVENRIAAGWLPRYKNGHLVLVDLDDVDAMITRTAQRR